MTKLFLWLAIITIASPTFAQNSDTLLFNKSKTSLSIIGVGDLMLGSTYPQGSLLPPNMDCSSLLSDVAATLSNADLTIGNLEGCLSDNAPREKQCRDTTICYAFRMPEKFGQCFKDAGFDVLTIANNHSGDFGYQGRESTVKILDSLGIYHAGWIKYPTSIFIIDSIKYGLAAFAPNLSLIHI